MKKLGLVDLKNLKSIISHTVWKDEKFTLTEKLFREINPLLKTYFSRDLSEKCEVKFP